MSKKEAESLVMREGKQKQKDNETYRKEVNEALDEIRSFFSGDTDKSDYMSAQFDTKVKSDGTHVRFKTNNGKRKFVIAPDMTEEYKKLEEIQSLLFSSLIQKSKMFQWNEDLSIAPLPSFDTKSLNREEDIRKQLTEIIESWGEYSEEGKEKIPELVDKILTVLPNQQPKQTEGVTDAEFILF